MQSNPREKQKPSQESKSGNKKFRFKIDLNTKKLSSSMNLILLCTIATLAIAIMGVAMPIMVNMINSNAKDAAAAAANVFCSNLNDTEEKLLLETKNLAVTTGVSLIVENTAEAYVKQHYQEELTNSLVEADYVVITDLAGKVMYTSSHISSAMIDPKVIEEAISGTPTSQYAAGVGSSFGIIAASDVKVNGIPKGAIILGFDLTNSHVVDNAKDRTGYEFTIYDQNAIVNTTIKDESHDITTGATIGDKAQDKTIKAGEIFTDNLKYGNVNLNSGVVPLKDSKDNIVGAVFAGKDNSETFKEMLFLIFGLIGIVFVLGVVIIIIASKVINKMFIKPIVDTAGIAEKLAKGELNIGTDTKFVIDTNAQTELGIMARSVETAANNMRMYIGEIITSLDAMAKNDFNEYEVKEFAGDFQEINDAIISMRKSISAVLIEMTRASEEVSNCSNEVSRGSTALASGSSEQAASSEELSASIESLLQQTTEDDKNLVDADEYSKNAEQKLAIGSKQIDNMLVAMGDIDTASKKISGIIKEIDEIAFQTNILSLNAAIEAAKAGKVGAGFSVVADEVRNLSQKSAQAAAQTQELIETTLAAVEKGKIIADTTASAFAEINEASKKTNEALSQVAESSRSRTTQLKSIAIGTEEIAKVVQDNSATAEESAAASDQLNEQAARLHDITERFKYSNTEK